MRRTNLSLLAFTLVTLTLPPAASARKAPPQAMPQQADCNVVVASGAMDRASCEALNQAQAAYNAARQDPNGARPGDEAMTCEQITAELSGQSYQAPNASHVTEARAGSTALMATNAKAQAEVAAMETHELAENLATSAAPLPNAAYVAQAARQDAEHKALNAQISAEAKPETAQMLHGAAGIASDLTPQMQNNPRLAHLIDLAQRKHCKGDGGHH